MIVTYACRSFILEVIYFFMATIASASGFLRPQSGTVGWFGATLVMLLHVTLGVGNILMAFTSHLSCTPQQ